MPREGRPRSAAVSISWVPIPRVHPAGIERRSEQPLADSCSTFGSIVVLLCISLATHSFYAEGHPGTADKLHHERRFRIHEPVRQHAAHVCLVARIPVAIAPAAGAGSQDQGELLSLPDAQVEVRSCTAVLVVRAARHRATVRRSQRRGAFECAACVVELRHLDAPPSDCQVTPVTIISLDARPHRLCHKPGLPQRKHSQQLTCQEETHRSTATTAGNSSSTFSVTYGTRSRHPARSQSHEADPGSSGRHA